MHKVRDKYRAKNLYRSSCFLISLWLLTPAIFGAAGYAYLEKTKDSIMILAGTVGLYLLTYLCFTITSSKCRCQLCQAKTMRSLKCTRNKKAKKILGSYRLPMALSIVFRGHFRCQYCGEPFTLKVNYNKR